MLVYTEMNVNAETKLGQGTHHCQSVYWERGEGNRRVVRRLFPCFPYISVLFEDFKSKMYSHLVYVIIALLYMYRKKGVFSQISTSASDTLFKCHFLNILFLNCHLTTIKISIPFSNLSVFIAFTTI